MPGGTASWDLRSLAPLTGAALAVLAVLYLRWQKLFLSPLITLVLASVAVLTAVAQLS